MSAKVQIDELLAESIDAASDRERRTFAEQLASTDGSVVLFGAGRLGRLCARALRRGGITLRAFCDRNPALHGTEVEGVLVLSEEQAAMRYGERSLLVVSIWTGTARESMVERITHLRALGARAVVPFSALVWAHGQEEVPFHSFELPTRILTERDALRSLADALHDDESKETLRRALQQRLRGEFTAFTPVPDQYFPRDLVPLAEDEVLVDGGAFDGDTLATFLERTGGRFVRYHAFEPDPITFERLRERVSQLPAEVRGRVQLHEVALMDRRAQLAFASSGTISSNVSVAGTVPVVAKQVHVQGATLDACLGETGVTFLKLDIEGAERLAIAGAMMTLERDQPLAAVCVYHEPTDLWEVPRLLRKLLPNHRLFLRQHGIDGWETVCYAVPPDRMFQAD